MSHLGLLAWRDFSREWISTGFGHADSPHSPHFPGNHEFWHSLPPEVLALQGSWLWEVPFVTSPSECAQCHPGPSEGMRSLLEQSVVAFTHQSGSITIPQEHFVCHGCSALSVLCFVCNGLLGSVFLTGL